MTPSREPHHDATVVCAGEPTTKARTPQTKSAAVQKLLSRNKGATLDEIMATTCWQPHSVRAFMTGLRKKGVCLVREARSSGETSWRIAW